MTIKSRFVTLTTTAMLVLNLLAIARVQAAAKEDALNLVQRILSDPLLPASMRNAQLVHRPDEKGLLRYNIQKPGQPTTTSLNICTLFVRDDAGFNIMVRLANDDVTEVVEEPDWAKMQLQWDAFVRRYWPGSVRIDDWRQEIGRYRANRGLFTIQYALKEQETEVLRVVLDIRLADGRVGGVVTMDQRYLVEGQTLPPPPAKEKIVAAFHQAFKQSPESEEIKNLRIDKMRRQILPNKKGQATVQILMNIRGNTADGRTILIDGVYTEADGKVHNLNAVDQAEIDSMRQKPYTTVMDTNPAWTSDGKQIYFVTTRDPRGRPWWSRAAVSFVPSLAFCMIQGDKADSPVLVRPLKSQGRDYNTYGHTSPSPTGHYLAATFSNSRFFVLDMQHGVLYLPQRDPKWGAALQEKWELPATAIPQGPQWEVSGAHWLPDESGLVLSMYVDHPDFDLYLVRRDPTKPPQEWELTPIAVERGEDMFPCLSDGGEFLAWAHQVSKKPIRTVDKKPDNQPDIKKVLWQVIIADFDDATGKLENRRILDLDSEPSSISWDSKGERWLVVTKEAMVWVQEIHGKLQKQEISEVKWGKLTLHPTSATVSPEGDRIAIAAKLSAPQIYVKSEAIVASVIFMWDGKGQQVQPLFEPSLNGLPRYEFPETKSTWARIQGNVKKFGLEGLADPKSFMIDRPLAESAEKLQ